MNVMQRSLMRYENWMERRPTQALLVHVGIYVGVSALIIGTGFAISQ